MQLVLDTSGLTLKHRNGCFWISGSGRDVLVNPAKVHSIAITASCTISTAAIRLALKQDIPVYFINKLGKVDGRLWSASFGRWADIRREQYLFGQYEEATAWVIRLLMLKTQGQLSNLAYLIDRKPGQAAMLAKARQTLEQGLTRLETFRGRLLTDCRDELMGFEGSVARTYWQALSGCMPDGWNFETRNRQPAHDFFNAGLNYLYGMLYGTVETALFSVGLDPYQGLLHGDQYDKPTLSFDFIEPFRPWADRLLIEVILGQQLSADGFQASEDGAVALTKVGKACLIPMLNGFLYGQGVFDGKRARRRNHIYRLAGALVDTLDKLNN